jgi:hypothetical protein
MNLSNIIIGDLEQTIFYAIFKNQARKRPTDFTRTRKMTFEELIIYMLFSLKCSTATALRRFFSQIGKYDLTMTQQSLSEARQKVNVWAFSHLFGRAVPIMIKQCRKKWHNYRVFAIDGTKIALPADKELRNYYGAMGPNKKAPTAQGSILYDVCNDIVCDAAIEPLATDERTLAIAHIEASKNIAVDDKKLFLFDRGYPSFELVELLEKEELYYVMRVKSNFNKDIDNQKVLDDYVCLEKDEKRIQVRVVKFALESGAEEILITNITDRRLGKKAFKKLYYMRWPVETKYDIVKNKLRLENFNTRTIEGIQQDFFASMFLTNLAAAMIKDAQEGIEAARKDKNNKYQYKANINEVVGIMKDRFVFAISQDDPDVQTAMIDDIVKDIERYVVPIRPDRHVPRNPYPRKTKFHHNRKDNS